MRKILIYMGALVSIIGVVFVAFIVHFAGMRQQYTSELKAHLNIYLHQQTVMLSRLAATLIEDIQQQNYKQMAELLSVYEEISYAQAQHGNAVPFSVQFVSLSAPPLIIGSFGQLDSEYLVSDQDYYSRVVDTPKALILSKFYSTADMPNYPMVNLGVGIVDENDKFYGQLDLKLSLISLHQYLQLNLNHYTEYFDFAFNEQQFTQPSITFHSVKCWLLCLEYMLWRVLFIITALGLVVLIYSLWSKNKHNMRELITTKQKMQQISNELSLIHTAQTVQATYAEMHDRNADEKQYIILQKLLLDVYAVNAEFAMQRAVQINLPENQNSNLRIYGNQLRLMQILSGILYELILQMGATGAINIKVDLTEQSHGIQLAKFIFSDNGYYDKLIAREHINSSADVRCKGWSNIYNLVDECNGCLEYSHTAYTGNTIVFSVSSVLANNNVVRLEAYMQD